MTYSLIIWIGFQSFTIGTNLPYQKCEAIRQFSIDRNHMQCVKEVIA